MIECPYCLGELAREAVVCRHCTRDITGQALLLRKVTDLQETVVRLTARLDAIESKDIAGQPVQPTTRRAPAVPSGDMRANTLPVIVLTLLPWLLLLAAYYAVVVRFSMSPGALLLATLAIPLPFGAIAILRSRQTLIFWLAAFATVSLASVLTMNLITYRILLAESEGMPEMSSVLSPLPTSLRELQEVAKFSLSIFFSFTTGMMIAIIYLIARRPDDPKLIMIVNNLGVLRGTVARMTSVSTVERLGKYAASLTTIGSALGAIYFGLTK